MRRILLGARVLRQLTRSLSSNSMLHVTTMALRDKRAIPMTFVLSFFVHRCVVHDDDGDDAKTHTSMNTFRAL